MSILGPEYFEEQLTGKRALENLRPAIDDSTKEAAFAQTFERSGTSPLPPPSASSSLSQVLRNRHIYFAAIRAMTDQFGGKIVDIAESSVIIELCGKSSRVEAFLELMRPFGVLESARTGASNIDYL